jgi:hypothetical protein
MRLRARWDARPRRSRPPIWHMKENVRVALHTSGPGPNHDELVYNIPILSSIHQTYSAIAFESESSWQNCRSGGRIAVARRLPSSPLIFFLDRPTPVYTSVLSARRTNPFAQ